MDFTNREIASTLWLFVGIIYCMRNKNVRTATRSLILSFFQWKIISILLTSYVYILICAYIMSKVNIWSAENLKETIIWAICYTLTTLPKANDVFDEDRFFIKLLCKLFEFSVIITFIIKLHSFSLIIEIIILPIIFLLVMMQSVAQIKHKGEGIEKILTSTLVVISLLYASYSLYITYIKIDKLATLSTLQEFFVPVILTITFIPFLYILALFFAYENVFTRLHFGIKSKQLRKKAQYKSLIEFKTNARALKRWCRAVLRFHPQNENELENIFIDSRAIAKREAKPPIVPRENGWSPYAIRDILSNEGIKIGNYTRDYQSKWFACSNYLKIDDSILANQICFYVTGTDIAVTEIKIVLYVNNPSLQDIAEDRFIFFATLIVSNFVNDIDAHQIINQLKKSPQLKIITKFETISTQLDKWEAGIKGGYSRTFTIRSTSHKGT